MSSHAVNMPSSTTISIASTAPTLDKQEGIEMVILRNVGTADIEVKGPLPAGMTKQSVKAAFLELVQKTLEMGFDFTNFCKAWVETCASDGLIALSMTPSTLTGKPERQFHWDIVISFGPERRSAMPGVRYRVKPHPTQGWVFERLVVPDVKNIPNLLGRIIIGKVENPDLVDRIISSTPMVLEDPEWRCFHWVEDALAKLNATGGLAITPARAALRKDAVLSFDADGNILPSYDFAGVMAISRDYIEGKIVHGRYTCYERVDSPRPTYSLISKKQIWK